jgi:hypothetical protein
MNEAYLTDLSIAMNKGKATMTRMTAARDIKALQYS